MAGYRKLQQEMDRVFKKINEGMEIFDTLYERHQTTSSTSQRDKLESELKKEIKKLQRFREQVKNWQATSEIKEKDQLLQYRRLVERAMEQYKVVERGAKLKAYSDGTLLDPGEELADNEATKFVRECLDEIGRQEEMLEAEVEKLGSGRRSRRNNSVNDERRQEIEETLGHHQWHREKLELILRLLENRKLEADEVMAIQDDIQYYLDDNQDPDFMNDDTMYDELDLTADAAIANEVHGSLSGPSAEDREREQHEREEREREEALEKEREMDKERERIRKEREATRSRSKSSSKSGSRSPATKASTLRGLSSVQNGSIGLASASTVPTVPTMNLKPAPVPKQNTEMKWSAAVTAAAHNNSVNSNGNANGTSSSSNNSNNRASVVPAPAAAPATPRTASSSMNMNALNAASVLEALKKQKPRDTVSGQSSSVSSRPASTRAAHVALSEASNTTPTSVTNTPPPPQKRLSSQPEAMTPLGDEVDETVDRVVDEATAESVSGEEDAERDPDFRFLPPGVQTTILASAMARDRAEAHQPALPLSLQTMLSTPRSFSPLPSNVYPPGLEAQRVSAIWSQVKASPSIEVDAQNVDTATLFYAYYYALSHKEREVAAAILEARQWRCNKERTMWYQRHSEVKARGKDFEIADYNVFQAHTWSLSEKRNFRIES